MNSNAPRPGKPSREIFDPFNSSTTGHQRAENRLSGSTSWRDSRSAKLKNQFKSGAGGGKRVSDTVGPGSLDFGQDGRTANGGWEKGAKGLRTGGQKSICEILQVEKNVERPLKRIKTEGSTSEPTIVVNPFTPFRKADGSIRETSWTSHESTPSRLLSPIDPNISFEGTDESPAEDNVLKPTEDAPSKPQIFAGLRFCVNGSTAPLISDHKLKQVLSEHGAGVSIALSRRTVTHVIIGLPNSNGGSGGGLSGSKLHKEVTRKGGSAVKYVTAEWVLESVKAGKRQPESKFAALSIAPKGVMSAADMFKRAQPKGSGKVSKDDGG
jgi:hypothetical protein